MHKKYVGLKYSMYILHCDVYFSAQLFLMKLS